MSYEIIQRGQDMLLKIDNIGYQKLYGTGDKAIKSLLKDLEAPYRWIEIGGVRLYLDEEKRARLSAACEQALTAVDEVESPKPAASKIEPDDETSQFGFYDADDDSDEELTEDE